MPFTRSLRSIIILAICLVPSVVSARSARTACTVDSIPRPTGYVNDYERLFTDSQRVALENLIAQYQHQTTIEIALVTIDADMTTTMDFDNFTLKMFNSWGVGDKKKNNGVLIGISRAFRKIRIQNGNGITKILSNTDTRSIIDTAIIPYLKKGQYYEGAWNGLQTLMHRLQ